MKNTLIVYFTYSGNTERLYAEGKLRAIGVSNFYPDRLVDLCLFAKVKPMVNQIEINVFDQRVEDKKWADKYGAVLEAWGPFGEGRRDMFHNPTLLEIGKKHGKSAAQVILRWLHQRGIVALAKSVHEERIRQNFEADSFALDEENMAKIAALDEKQSLFFDHRDPAIVEWFGDLILKRRNRKRPSSSARRPPFDGRFFLFSKEKANPLFNFFGTLIDRVLNLDIISMSLSKGPRFRPTAQGGNHHGYAGFRHHGLLEGPQRPR